jgi:hypothetical protein
MEDAVVYDLLRHASQAPHDGLKGLNGVRQLYEMTLDGTLRDSEWTTCDVYSPLFLLIQAVCDTRSIFRESLGAFVEGNGEALVWRIMRYMLESPHDFNDRQAAESDVITERFIECVFDRLVDCSTATTTTTDGKNSNNNNNNTSTKDCAGIVTSSTYLLHWLYAHREDKRKFIRTELSKRVLVVATPFSTKVAKGMIKRGIGQDGDGGRAHVKPLLELLHSILAGLTLNTDKDSESSRSNDTHSSSSSSSSRHQNATRTLPHNLQRLLMDVLLPLHEPSEFVEWRDQVPVRILFYVLPFFSC